MSAEVPVLLAIDCGSSALKVGAFDPLRPEDGLRVLAAAAMQIERPAPGRALMRASAILTAAGRCLRRAADGLPRGRSVAVGICGHVSSLIALDPDRGSVREDAFPIWADTAATAAIPGLEADCDRDWAPRELGSALPWASNWLLVKARHAGAPQPNAVLVQVGDLLHHWLTGELATHPSAQVSLIDQRRGDYAPAALDLAGLEPHHLPPLRRDDASPLRAERCRELGLPTATSCRAALADMSAAFLAPGLADGEGIWLANTSEILGRFDRARDDAAPQRVLRCALGDGTLRYGSTRAGGANLSWCCERLLGRPPADLDRLEALAARIPAGCGGLIHLPFIDGERAPLWNAELRAGFRGLGAHHGHGELFRSVIEGVAFGKRLLAEHLEAPLPARFAIGGGGSRPLANRIRAAVLGRPLRVCAQRELGLVGVLRHLLRAEDLDEAPLDRALRWHRVDPDPAWVPIYDEAYARFRHHVAEELQPCPMP